MCRGLAWNMAQPSVSVVTVVLQRGETFVKR
jgi:hypothetical protein